MLGGASMASSVNWNVLQMAERFLSAAQRQRLYGIVRIHVLLAHEPAGFEGTDRQQRHTDARVAHRSGRAFSVQRSQGSRSVGCGP